MTAIAAADAAVAHRDDTPPGTVPTPDPDKPIVDKPPADAEDTTSTLEPPKSRNFPFAMTKADPAVFEVPAEATKKDIAARLFLSEQYVDSFDIEQAGGERGARVRTMGMLQDEAVSAMRSALDGSLKSDADRVVSILCQRRIDENDEIRLVQYVAKWSKRSNLTDSAKVQYFTRFLNELDGRTLVRRGVFSDTTKTALQWLYVEAEEKDTAVGALVSANSTRAVPEDLATKAPGQFGADVSGLPRYHVVGYYRAQWPKGPMALTTPDPQLRAIMVWDTIAVEDDARRAETAVRNSPKRGPRVMIPVKDGKFYGFSIGFEFFDENYVPPKADEHKPTLEDYWFIFPGTVFVKGGEYQPEFREPSTPEEKAQKTNLLGNAIGKATSADPSPALGLDFDVLATATLDQRISLLKTIVNTPNAADTKVPDLIARIVYATPAKDFPLLERRMATEGITEKLLQMNVGTNVLAVIGRVFTVKTLASMPLGSNLGGDLETFTVGKDSDGWFHYATAGNEVVDSSAKEKGKDDPDKASSIGNEPPIEGAATGPFKRSAIVFYVTKVKASFSNPPAVKSRPFLPFELVRVNVIGQQPRTMIVTAMEAAGLLDIGKQDLWDVAVKPFVQVYSVAFATTGLLRVFGAAVAEGLMAGGVRAAVAGAGEVAVTRAGAAALFDAVVLGSLAVVEGYRSELASSEAGRKFLAVYDVAMTVLIARDLYRLATSGILTKIATAGAEAWTVASTEARVALARTIDEATAIATAAKRTKWITAEQAVEAGTGALMKVPENPETFRANLMVARGEVAGRRLATTLKGAGRDTATAESIMARLEKVTSRDIKAAPGTEAEAKALAQQKAAAKAQMELAARVPTMAPGDADKFLQSVKSALETRPGSVGQIADFITAAAKSSDPAAYMTEVQRLLDRGKVTGEALQVLAAKARTGALDVKWLNSTSITDKMLDSIGRDPRTPWNALKTAAADPSNTKVLSWARASLRGIGAEVVTEESLAKILPGHRMTGAQVSMEGSVIDYSVAAIDATGATRAVEVKGWTVETWREALRAYKVRLSTPAALSEAESKALEKIDHMIGQLANARKATGHPAYLVVTDGLTGPVRNDLNLLLKNEAAGTTVKTINEEAIKTTAKDLGTSLGIPPP